METAQEQHGHRGAFYVEQDGKRVAEMTYTISKNGTMIILHTGVSEEMKGKNAGKQLVTAAVNYARENQIKIIPLCPFAKAVLNRVEDFHDVLA